jgi:hypothetical protein
LPAKFFHPVQLDLEPSDLLVQLNLLAAGVPGRGFHSGSNTVATPAKSFFQSWMKGG